LAKPKSIYALSNTQLIWFLSLAHEDFHRACIAAREALAISTESAHAEVERRVALGEAAVVRYARPFKRCVVPQQDPSLRQLSVAMDEDYLPTDIGGASDFHAEVLHARDSIAAHTDIAYRPVLIRRRDIRGLEWRVDTACFVPDMGDDNLNQLVRVATALREKTAIEVGKLVMTHYPRIPLDEWMKLLPDGLVRLEGTIDWRPHS
jgi:hypothetical protein